MEQFTQAQWSSWGYGTADPFPTYTQLQAYPAYLADSIEAAYQSHQQHLLHNQQLARTTESKPRLSKEEVEILEAEFQKNHKPNSSTKKALAESMRVDNARINNWFQNRRAREKKENNIRAYEAKQRLEKDSTEPISSSRSDDEDDAKYNLVASSAPFPDPPKVSRQLREVASESQSPDNEDITKSQLFETSSSPSPIASTSDHFSEVDSADLKRSTSEDFVHIKSEQMNEYLSMPSNTAEQTADLTLDTFSSYVPTHDKATDYLVNSGDFFMDQDETTSHTYENSQGFLNGFLPITTSDYSGHQDAGNEPIASSLSPEVQLKSPPVIDIAARRNRRPPPLSLNGGRGFASPAPKTAADLTARRGDFGGSMRRVASANGPVRITKASLVASQRSPFTTERMADGLFRLNRSPSLGNGLSPPTPNTPFVSTQQGSGDGVSLPFVLDTKFPGSEVIGQDPTLRTPPTTPGIMDQLFNLNGPFDMSLGDEPLATPGLTRFPGEFELPNMPSSVPGYIAHGCTSQPETPVYTPHMGPAYFGNYTGGNTEYNWSDASNSAKSSPGQNPQSVQFMNMTASNFSYVEEH